MSAGKAMCESCIVGKTHKRSAGTIGNPAVSISRLTSPTTLGANGDTSRSTTH